MIWVRRFFAVVLGLVLLVVLVVSVVLRTARQATDPAFVKAELVKVDAYGFIYGDVLETVVGDAIEEQLSRDRIEGLPEALAEFRFEDPARVRAVVLDAIRDTFPPEYTRQQAEAALDELLPYLKGETGEFEVRPELDERVRAAARAITTVIDELDLATQLIDSAIGPNLDNALGQLSIGGAQLQVSPERAREIAHRIAPEPWVNEQIANALAEIVAWLTGDQDSFTVRIQFADRVPAARDEIQALLAEAEFTDFLFDTVIAPRLSEALGTLSVLSYGVDVSDREVRAALETVAPKEWVDEQLGDLIGILAAYISGASDELELTVPLGDRRSATIAALTGLADTKLRQLAAQLPVCGSQELAAQAGLFLASLQLPSCVPQGVDTSAVVDSLLPVLARDLDRLIGANFPQQVTFSRSMLESQLGTEAFAAIDQARELIGGGFAWTDQDLARLTEANGVGTAGRVEEIRKYFQNDYALTQADLLTSMDAGQITQFDRVRSIIRTVTAFAWLSVLLPVALAGAIGFLGGRQWYSRLAWGAGALAITALIIWVAIMQAYDRFQPVLHDRVVEDVASGIGDEKLRQLALKAIGMAETLIGDVVAGAAATARNWTIAGASGVAGAIAWWYYARATRSGDTAVSRWIRARMPARRGTAARNGEAGGQAGDAPRAPGGGDDGSGGGAGEPSRPPGRAPG